MTARNSEDLFSAAKAVRERAYVPYSGHRVGAAVRTGDGKVYSGCNIENSSYGATTCAERVAIQTALAESGPQTRITEVMVVTDATPAWPPCGMCRQVIAEFADKGAVIHAANLRGETKSLRLSELFPDAFTPDHLKRP